ncbi:MAG TPA: hypothetical protein VE871_05740 [Longimicrobium sp.]|nr:hypothetical protein [Longimicrobium sp.]
MTTETTALPGWRGAKRKPGFFKNLLYWIMDWDDPAFVEEGVRRMRSAPRYFASMSPETLEYLRNYDGPENSGPPLTRRERRDLERRLATRA